MSSKLASVIFSLFTAVVVAPSADAMVVSNFTNGNFEQGSTGWTLTGNVAVVTQYGAGFNWGGGSVAQDGTYAVSFNSGDRAPTGVVSQTFATVVGTTYTVQFDYGTTSPSAQTLDWSILGANQAVINSGHATDTNTAALLDTYFFTFVANSQASTLRFVDDAANYTVSNDALLDNVSVTARAVPEPGSLALLGLGLAGIGALRRRKAG